jgi:hypothetical protein
VAAETQRFYLHADTGMDYAKQFLAEELKKTRGGKRMWVKIGRDNHLLDCEVYAAACAHYTWYPNLLGFASYLESKKKAPVLDDDDEGGGDTGYQMPATGNGWINNSKRTGGGWVSRGGR